jgi:protein gp37
MPSKTKIEWADYVSNPIRAVYISVTETSHQVKNGYACVKISEGCAHCWASGFNVRLGTGLEYTEPNLARVDEYLSEKELERLLTFKPGGPFKNGRERGLVFVCDMTDLFSSWHSFEKYARPIFYVFERRQDMDFLVLTKRPIWMMEFCKQWARRDGDPLPNVFLGVSIENDMWSARRRGAMREISGRGWKTVVSYEPALEMVDWAGWEFIDGMMCGGESGAGARMMHPNWARAGRDFCQANSIPFFFKAWGEWAPLDQLSWINATTLLSHKPVMFQGAMMGRVGKGKAGHLLDGREWREMPERM